MWYEGPEEYPPARPKADEDYYRGSMDHAADLSVIDLLREREALTPDSTKIVFVMVGSNHYDRLSTAIRLSRFLSWRGADVEVFEIMAEEKNIPTAVEGVLQWMRDGGEIAIFDSENGTESKRRKIAAAFKAVEGDWFNSIGVVFIEIIPEMVPRQKFPVPNPGKPPIPIKGMTRVSSTPSMYKIGDADGAPSPTQSRRIGKTVSAPYRGRTYESIDLKSRHSFLKIYNGLDKVMASRVYGRITKSILPFLMAISRRKQRPIWLVRAGRPRGQQSRSGEQKMMILNSPDSGRYAKIDSDGEKFAKWLSAFIEDKIRVKGDKKISKDDAPRLIDGRSDRKNTKWIKIMTSTLSRAHQTTAHISWAGNVEQYGALNPLDKGLFPGLRFWEAEKEAPEFFRRWVKDKYNTRFPAGESYHDVRVRLEQCLIEIEQQSSPVLVLAHGTVLQVLLCYFTGKAIDECWKVTFPHHTVMEFSPNPYSARGQWAIRSYYMDPKDKKQPVGRHPPGPPSIRERRMTGNYSPANLGARALSARYLNESVIGAKELLPWMTGVSLAGAAIVGFYSMYLRWLRREPHVSVT